MNSQHQRVPVLTSTEKKAVIAEYSLVKSNKKYAYYLQQFIIEHYQKQVSTGYIYQLVSTFQGKPSTKRKRKIIIPWEIVNASSSPGFDWNSSNKSLRQLCINVFPELANVKANALDYHLRKLREENGYQPLYRKRKASRKMAEPYHAHIPKSEEEADSTPRLIHLESSSHQQHPTNNLHEDITMQNTSEQSLGEDFSESHAVEQIFDVDIPSTTKYSVRSELLIQDYSSVRNSHVMTGSQMNIDGYIVECKTGDDARLHYSNKLSKVMHASHRVSLSNMSPANEYMFLYYGQRRSMMGCIFLDIGSGNGRLTIYWLYTKPDQCFPLGHTIVAKLFLCFPDATFTLCSKREAAPFWEKMGFVPEERFKISR